MSYRQRKIQKKVNGRIKRYRNLRSFNEECPKRGMKGNICVLSNVRKLKDGSGMATVLSRPLVDPAKFKTSSKARGTWLLHFASYDVMKRHLKGRVDPESRLPQNVLDGARRRRR